MGRRKIDQNNSGDQSRYWNDCLQKVGASQDRRAFRELFEHFSPLLISFVRKGYGISQEAAEEIVQETLVKVWRKAPSFTAQQSSASTWIYTIARNTRIDWYRKEAARTNHSLSADDLYELPDESPLDSALVSFRSHQQINQSLAMLPDEQSTALRLMYFEGKSGQEVAETLDLPLGTVKSRIRLALKKLKLTFAAADSNRQGHQQ